MKKVRMIALLFTLVMMFSLCAAAAPEAEKDSLANSVKVAAACTHPTLDEGLYCEAEHPHPYFRFCLTCGEKVYVGGYATKNHGDGSWGSGTCPKCGTHTYVGQSCTTSGTCKCGATASALGHSFSTGVSFESSHPHSYYRYCTRCGVKSYLGGTNTLPHGNGTGGTCRYCGTHTYQSSSLTGVVQEHPHKDVQTCACGASITLYGTLKTCSQCREGSITASNRTSKTGVIMYLDGDNGMGTLVTFPATCTVGYMNEYKMITEFPSGDPCQLPFTSFRSSVSSTVSGQPVWASGITAVANVTVEYYDASGNLLASQQLKYTSADTSSAYDGDTVLFLLPQKPAYTITRGTCFGASGSLIAVTNVTNF